MKCPQCSQIVPDTANVCGYCGFRLALSEPEAPLRQQFLQAHRDRPSGTRKGLPCGIRVLIAIGVITLSAFGVYKVANYFLPPPVPSSPGAPPLAPLPTISALDQGQPTIAPPRPVEVTNLAVETPVEAQETPPPAIPSGVSRFIDSPQILAFDAMDSLDTSRWNDPLQKARAVNGALILAASGQEAENPWAWLGDVRRYASGEAVLFRLKFEQSTRFEIHMSSGQWDTGEYKRWGLHKVEDPYPKLNLWRGTTRIDEGQAFAGELELAAHHWYYLLAAVDGNTGYQVVWDPENPGVIRDSSTAFEPDWEGIDWGFQFQVFQGILHLDECYSLSFEQSQD